MKHLRFLLFLVVALVLVTALPAGAERTLDSETGVEVLFEDGEGRVIWQVGDWIWRNHLEPLNNTYRLTLKGESDGETCVFSYEEIVQPEATAVSAVVIEEREIAYNEKACEMVLEGGERSGVGGFTGSASEVLLGPSDGAAMAGSGGSRTMWQRLYYEDPWPIQADVTWVKSQMSYSWNGSCVTSQGATVGSRGWIAATGWYETLWQTSKSGTVCQPYVWYRTKGYYYNYAFCSPALPTYTKYYANEVRGYPNGAWGYYYSVGKWGDCSWLLTFKRTKSP